jgi:hypothetical protein
MIYYRPRFIPPETVPDGSNGIVWFLDEANRAHPTVIQTLFQIITEHMCGEHPLPPKTAIVLAGNLGESDNTTITEFDDAALDGRLAILHLKPDAPNWLHWANRSGIHPAIIRYISIYPEKLWDMENINPNPRGWHQVSQAINLSYELPTEDDLKSYLVDNPENTLIKIILSLICEITGSDFIAHITAPREITTEDILSGSENKLILIENGSIPAEDILWSLSGALQVLREKKITANGPLPDKDLLVLGNVLQFIGSARADTRISFFYRLLKECGIFTQIPAAVKTIKQKSQQEKLQKKLDGLIRF